MAKSITSWINLRIFFFFKLMHVHEIKEYQAVSIAKEGRNCVIVASY